MNGHTSTIEVLQSSLRNSSPIIEKFKQSILSLSFNIGGLLSGTLLSLNLGVFTSTPWAFVIFPGILSMRGMIGGLFVSHLSTGLHLGTVRASFMENTRGFYVLWRAIIALTFATCAMMGLVSSLFGMLLWGATFFDSVSIFGVIFAAMGLSLVIVSPITVGVSFLSFKRGLDPDIVVYPVMSTVADIIVTFCYVVTLNVFSLGQMGYYTIGFFDIVFFSVVIFVLLKSMHENQFVKIIKESFVTLILVAFIVNVTGSILTKISEVAGGKPEVYTVYPALIATVGSVGAVTGSTATTKLALGTLKSSFRSIKEHKIEIGGAWMASFLMFTLYFAVPLFQGMPLPELLKFIGSLYLTNILAVLCIVIISFLVAILTFRKGLDPDNFVIPIESSLADTLTSVSLLLALSIFR
jgi:mgtE-like transporter